MLEIEEDDIHIFSHSNRINPPCMRLTFGSKSCIILLKFSANTHTEKENIYIFFSFIKEEHEHKLRR